jgi:hypothetical protein
MDAVGPLVEVGLWLIDRFRDVHQTRRRVRVLVHLATFQGGFGATALTTSPGRLNASVAVTATGFADPNAVSQYYFMKVVNLSPKRDVWITHAWFDTNPPVDTLSTLRPLQAKLGPDQEWEGWTNAAYFAEGTDVERAGRVRLSSGRIVKSRPNKKVPPSGPVAGSGSR